MSDDLPGGHLRASDADREQVATLLTTAYTEGRLTREEHDERVDQARRARTFGDLMPLTFDLLPSTTATDVAPLSTAVPATRPARTWTVDTTRPTEQPELLVGVFGGTTRRGRWRVRRRTHAYALFGGFDLDMTEATFENPVVQIDGGWCFGGLDITVPPGIEVHDQTMGIFGGTEVKDLDEPVPGAPVLVIKGLCLFGGVSVHGPKRDKKRDS